MKLNPFMSIIQTALDHLKNHIEYPATREEAIAACNNFADVPKAEAEWFANNLPKGKYKNPEELVKTLLQKV